MKSYLRLDIKAKDYTGVSYEILRVVYEQNLNLDSVEVAPGEIRLKVEAIDELKQKQLTNSILLVEGVSSVTKASLLESEFNKRKFSALINSLEDGVVIIDDLYNIRAFNERALEIFDMQEEILSSSIDVLKSSCPLVVEKIKKNEEIINLTFDVELDSNTKEYIASSKAFLDDEGNATGLVLLIKSADEAVELANIINLEREGAFKEIVGSSPAIKAVKNLISLVAKNNSTILLRGESGTGKELFARAIQNLSVRRTSNFFTLNCAAIPDSLIESELFGYEKGSFTGASENGKIGLFEEANGGTIFLDEIGELSLKMQSKLLRVLQEGKIRRVGSNTEISIDVRIIAATNRDLEKMISEKTFREDLFYRLNVIPVFIPPLNERRIDIPDLVAVFIHKYNMKLKMDVKGLEPDVLEYLIYHDWKGNVRQLENVIERAMNLTAGKIIRIENLMLDVTREASETMLLASSDNLKLKELVEICEKSAIEKVLKTQKSYRKSANQLGVSHTTLINKVKKYKLDLK